MVNKNLKADRKARVEKVAEQAANFLETNNTHEAYQYLQGWYKPTKTRASNPTDNKMQAIQQEYKNLYTTVTPTEPPIQTHTTYDIDDTKPGEEEIVRALRKMRLNKAPGPSGITINTIQQWHQKARDKDEPCQHSLNIWEKVLQLIQLTFTEGDIPVSFSYGVLVLIPKPDNQGFRGIALLETIYKIISMIIHIRLTSSINLHEAVHGF
jgi:hypothetical protein